MTESEKADAWRTLAGRTARKVNWGWWVERLTPMLIVFSLLAASGLLVLRSMDVNWQDHLWIPGVAGGLLLLICLIAWVIAKRRFIGAAEGLVRLEDRLHLKNALTTADRGIGAWPELPGEFMGPPGGWRWKPWRLAAPFLISVGMIALGAFLPITAVIGASKPPSEPSAWALMDEWAATLEEEDLIEESALKEVREKIEELRNQPEDEWFSHSSMEASDNLRDTLSRQIQKMGSDLAMAERDLNALQNYAAQLSEEGKERLLGEYDQALQDLAINGLPLDSELLKALQGLDLKQLAQGQMSQLTPEQLDQLREALKKGCKACKMCAGDKDGLPKPGEGDEALMALLSACQMGGRGGIDRGPGEAPLFFGDEQDLKTNNVENVNGQDYSRAAPGDLLATGEAEHDIDKTKVGPRKAGAVSSLGQGGEAIWRESLMPKEKAVLKRYFEAPEEDR